MGSNGLQNIQKPEKTKSFIQTCFFINCVLFLGMPDFIKIWSDLFGVVGHSRSFQNTSPDSYKPILAPLTLQNTGSLTFQHFRNFSVVTSSIQSRMSRDKLYKMFMGLFYSNPPQQVSIDFFYILLSHVYQTNQPNTFKNPTWFFLGGIWILIFWT